MIGRLGICFVLLQPIQGWHHLEVEDILQEEAEMPKTRVSIGAEQYMQPELPEKKKTQGLIDAVTSMRSKLRVC